MLLAVGAGALLAALCAVALWLRLRRVPLRRGASPAERTLERLDAARRLMDPATAREFGVAASEAIRAYIEQRFAVSATQRTTEEFLQALVQGSDQGLAPHRVRLARFLEECDVVKFAGGATAVADMELLLQSARTFVLETGEPSRP